MPEYAFEIALTAVARVSAADEKAALRALQDRLDCASLDITLGTVLLTEASIDTWPSPDLFEIDGRALDEDTDPDDCTCADRSWYGPEHDSACPHAGESRPSFICDAGDNAHG